MVQDWRTEFQYLLDRKMLSRDELAYLFGQVKSILDAENKRLRKALERLNSGKAIYVAGMIPLSIRSEMRARRRFTILVLEGKSVEDAESQACDEAVAETSKELDQFLKEKQGTDG